MSIVSRFFFILFALTGILSCKGVDKLTQFEIEYHSTATIPSSSAINLLFNVFTPDIESNSATNYELNDTRKDRIEQVILQREDWSSRVRKIPILAS